MIIKLVRLILMCSLIIIAMPNANAIGVTVRGKVERETSSGIYPAPSTQVKIFSERTRYSGTTYTDVRGFYYLHKIEPGNYVISVSTPLERDVRRSVQVTSEPYVDVPPIRVR